MIQNEEIVKIWQKAISPKAAAEELGMKVKSFSQRVGYLRKKGVNLKKFPKGRNVINIQVLNELAKESLI